MEPQEEQEDKAFDPTLHTAEYVAVAPDDSFAQIRDKVEDALKRTPNVILVIPRGSQAFHTTQDFLALGKLQWRREVRVAVATPDPTIAGLARVLGFYIVSPPTDHPALAGDPSFDNGESSDGPGTIEKPTAPLALGTPGTPDWVLSPVIPIYTAIEMPTTSGSLTTSTWLSMPGDGMAAHAAVAPRFPARPGQPLPRTRQRQTGQLLPTQIPDLSQPAQPGDIDLSPQTEEAKARIAVMDGKAYRNGRRWRYSGGLRPVRLGHIFAALGLALAIALIGVSGYAYVYLPEGIVSVIPQSKTWTALPVRVVVTGAQAAGLNLPGPQPQQNQVSAASIIAGTINQPLSASSTISSTGTRQVARGAAQGIMHFANNTQQVIDVPQGATFKSAEGITVQTTQAATVPGTFVLSNQIGSRDVPIIATIEGPDGNLPAGKLSGTYKGALSYTNPDAMQGGTMATVQVVAQADVDKLVSDLTAGVQGQVGGAILENVPTGQRLITETIRLEDARVEKSHNAGEDGDSLAVTVSGVARAYTYDEQKMQDSLRQAVYDYIQSNEPSNYGPVTDLAGITFTAPTLVSLNGENGVIEFGADASAHVKYTLTTLLAGQIRDLVKGKDIQQARSLITQQYGGYVAAGPISAKVLWFSLDTLPSDPARISIAQAGPTNGIGKISTNLPNPQADNSAQGTQR